MPTTTCRRFALTALAALAASYGASASTGPGGSEPAAPPEVNIRSTPLAPPERRPRLAFTTVAFEDSSGVTAVEPRLVATMPTAPADVTLGAGLTRLGRGARSEAWSSGGVAVSFGRGSARAGAAYATHFGPGAAMHDVEVNAGYEGAAGWGAAAAWRRHPFAHPVPALAADDQLFYSAGPGGASDAFAAARLPVNDVRLTAHAPLSRAVSTYLEAHRFDVDDGNRGWTASFGAGAELTAAAGLAWPVRVVVRYDGWAASWAEERPAYYAPAGVATHSPGVELRARAGPLEVAGEAGFTFVGPGEGSSGLFGGGSAVLRLGAYAVVARAQSRTDPSYASKRAWVVVQREF
jgi:hypothetical protein